MTNTVNFPLPDKMFFDPLAREVKDFAAIDRLGEAVDKYRRELIKQQGIAFMVEPFLAMPGLDELIVSVEAYEGYDDQSHFTDYSFRFQAVFSERPAESVKMWGSVVDPPQRWDDEPLVKGESDTLDEWVEQIEQCGTPHQLIDFVTAAVPYETYPAVQVTLTRTKMHDLLSQSPIDLEAVLKAATVQRQ
ncbi:MAG: hypothetical protein ING75_14725 [Rhodocyclaceae bacterium]|nr:hypothetical protein [Rhodocyclaceae bacterium]